MATIRHQHDIAVPAERAWAMLRRVDRADRLFAPVLIGCTMEGDVRTVTFANGMVVREQVVTVDDAGRRLAYSVLGDMFERHAASMEILPLDADSCRFVWTSDFLPAERAETVRPLVIEGASALVRNIEREAGAG